MTTLVSIHALLAECDLLPSITAPSISGFNPRTPCGVRRSCSWFRFPAAGFNPRTPCGVRPCIDNIEVAAVWFQSTHSLRSATFMPTYGVHITNGFNPRTPCGVRRRRGTLYIRHSEFQSTHSLRSATATELVYLTNLAVSIHALLAECDCARPYTLLLNRANHTLRQPP